MTLLCSGGGEDIAAVITEESSSFGFLWLIGAWGWRQGSVCSAWALGARSKGGVAQTASGSHQEPWLSSHRAMSKWV